MGEIFQKLAQPAQRALDNAGIHTLEQLASHTEEEIANLHGIGPNALAGLKAELHAQGRTFLKEQSDPVGEYILQFSPEVQEKLQTLRRAIREAAPEAQEKISWGMATFTHFGNLVHFAANKNHTGFYPGANGVAVFADKLSEYETSKGAIQFPYSKPLPLDLVKEIVRFRVQENTQLHEAKKKH